MSQVIEEAKERLRARQKEIPGELALVEEAVDLTDRLEEVLAQLGHPGKASARARGRGRRSRRPAKGPGKSRGRSAAAGRKRKKAKLVSREERERRLVIEAKKKPTASNVELAKALGINPSYVSVLLSRMKGRLERRDGQLVVVREEKTKAGGKEPASVNASKNAKGRKRGSKAGKKAKAAKQADAKVP